MWWKTLPILEQDEIKISFRPQGEDVSKKKAGDRGQIQGPVLDINKNMCV